MVTPEIIYLLRCQFLHSGNERIEERIGNNFIFELTITGNSMFGMSRESFELDDLTKRIRINIKDLCEKICMAATDYYEDKEDKSVFDKYSISPINYQI